MKIRCWEGCLTISIYVFITINQRFNKLCVCNRNLKNNNYLEHFDNVDTKETAGKI